MDGGRRSFRPFVRGQYSFAAIAIAVLLFVALGMSACSENGAARKPAPTSPQAVPILFEVQNLPAAGNMSRALSSSALSSVQAVTLNPALASLPLNTPVAIVAPSGQRYNTTFTTRQNHVDGSVTVSGFLTESGPSYSALLTVGPDGILFGRIQTPNGLISLQSDGSANWMVDSVAAGWVPAGEFNDIRVPTAQAGGLSARAIGAAATPTPPAGQITTIDVLLAYPTSFATKYPGAAAQTRLTQLVEVANTAFRNSTIDINLRAVGTLEVPYGNTANNDTALDAMSPGTGFDPVFQPVVAMRDKTGADLVVFVRPFSATTSRSCGVSWINGVGGAPLDPNLGYSVVSEGLDGINFCDDHTLAHEIGHAMGSVHDAANSPVIGHFTYSYGFGAVRNAQNPQAIEFGTVMSYMIPQSGRFSNPNISTCFGIACGVAGKADNALSLNNVRGTVADFRAAVTVTGPPTVITRTPTAVGDVTATANATVNSQNLTTNTFFEYGLTATYGQKTASRDLPAATTATNVALPLAGLSCSRTYHYRAVASNTAGTVNGDDVAFTTRPCPVLPQATLGTVTAVVAQTQATIKAEVNPNGLSTTVKVDFGATTTYGKTTALTNAGSGKVAVVTSIALSGLTCGTTYHFRVTASSASGTAIGNDETLTTAACAVVSVTALAPTDIGVSSATLGAKLAAADQPAEIYFEVTSAGGALQRTGKQTFSGGAVPSQVKQFISGLQCSTAYTVKAVALIGTSNLPSTTQSFTTITCATASAIVITDGPTEITAHSVRLNGTVDADGFPTSTYFEYGRSTAYGSVTPTQAKGDGTLPQRVSFPVFDLLCGTTYNYRLVVARDEGNPEPTITPGPNQSFATTQCPALALESINVEWTGSDAARIAAMLVGVTAPIDFFAQYGTSAQMGSQTPLVEPRPESNSTVVAVLSDLKCNTTYFYQLKATAGTVTITSPQGTFKTTACIPPPAVTTLPATTVGEDAATLEADVATSGIGTSLVFEYTDGEATGWQTTTPLLVAGATARQKAQVRVDRLVCSKTYRYRATVSNVVGKADGSERSFATNLCLRPVGAPISLSFVQIAAGDKHTLVVRQDGAVASFGDNALGQLGAQAGNQRLVPQVSYSDGLLLGVVDVAGGGAHSVALLEDKSLFAWGENQNGQLGDNTTASRGSPKALFTSSGTVWKVFTDVAAGQTHTVALADDGLVYTWGYNASGQLGVGDLLERNAPELVQSITNATQVAAGANHSLALLKNGTLLAWGANESGQLGDGGMGPRNRPTSVAVLTDIVKIFAGGNQSFAIARNGNVYAWGNNQFGQLGVGPVPMTSTPSVVKGVGGNGNLSGMRIVAPGAAHTLALAESGEVFAWGDNSKGQLGTGSVVNSAVPVPLSGAPGSRLININTIAAGGKHSAAISTAGEVWAWGDNSAFQLGTDTMTMSTAPTKVLLLPDSGGASISVNATALEVNEGGSVNLLVSLGIAPTSDTTVTITPADAKLTVTPNRLTFTTGNWDRFKTVIVRAAADTNKVDDTSTLSVTTAGATPVAVTVAIIDGASAAKPQKKAAASSGGAMDYFLLMLATTWLFRFRNRDGSQTPNIV